jgi:hypothetical protein
LLVDLRGLVGVENEVCIIWAKCRPRREIDQLGTFSSPARFRCEDSTEPGDELTRGGSTKVNPDAVG